MVAVNMLCSVLCCDAEPACVVHVSSVYLPAIKPRTSEQEWGGHVECGRNRSIRCGDCGGRQPSCTMRLTHLHRNLMPVASLLLLSSCQWNVISTLN